MKKKGLAALVILGTAALGAAIIAVSVQRSPHGTLAGAAPDEAFGDAGRIPSGMPSAGAQDGKVASGKGFPGGAMPDIGASTANAKSVRAKAAEIKTLRPYLDQGGDVNASVTVSVYPEIGGKLTDLAVEVGDSVSKGSRIASIDPSKPGSSYALSEVPAPIAGTVTAVLVNAGETVSSNTAIAKIGDIDDLEISVALPERDSAKVKKGMKARISLEALPGESLAATVVRVSPVLDSTSRTREVTVKLDSKDDRVAAGMYASVRIFTAPLADRVVIPSVAVVTRDEETFVYIVADESGKKVARKRTVAVGTSVDAEIEVKEGLSAGDLVVYEGQDLLSDGAEVTVIGEQTK
jgi:multidrug efflux pump subunit AcrA (membrane-fusion protein)